MRIKNKKVVLYLSGVIVLGGGVVALNIKNNQSKEVAVVTSKVTLSTQIETTTKSDITQDSESAKSVEEKQNEALTTTVQDSTQEVKQEMAEITKSDESKQMQTYMNTQQTVASQPKKPVEQPKQNNNNNNVESTNIPKNNTTNHNNHRTNHSNSSSNNSQTYHLVTKENTKQAHPDSYYIEQQARDSQGRRVPFFKTFKEAAVWGEKHADNETWYGAQGWAVRAVITESNILIGYFPYMHSFD